MALTDPILGKPWYQSFTAWGLVFLVGVIKAIEQACAPDVGLLSPELCATLVGWSHGIGELLVVIGLRKAATVKNPPVEPAGGA